MSFWSDLGDAISGLFEAVSDALTSIAEGIGNVISGIANGIGRHSPSGMLFEVRIA